jgi:hypothetical protein
MVTPLIGDKILTPRVCKAGFVPGSTSFNLGKGRFEPGFENSPCALDVVNSNIRTLEDEQLNVTFAFDLTTTTLHGGQNVYFNAFDTSGQLMHWIQGSILDLP